ncbi:Hypothetical predicted protein [Octopus vulgaris]|uniref:Uncharacterized protein n=1 Tax=Octopus vulgaris TaxID=6645 RepID=A0AA36B269_OCTVU|nr:Hypothetical predicted protein [Octopus vulgaris]
MLTGSPYISPTHHTPKSYRLRFKKSYDHNQLFFRRPVTTYFPPFAVLQSRDNVLLSRHKRNYGDANDDGDKEAKVGGGKAQVKMGETGGGGGEGEEEEKEKEEGEEEDDDEEKEDGEEE